MHLSFSETKSFVHGDLVQLYKAVGWSGYTQNPENLVPMVANSWYVCSAYDGQQLVGLVRVVGDGLTIAYIQDVLVLPSHQRQGIGSELMRRTLERIRKRKIRQTYLSTDTDSGNQHVIDFYSTLGFKNISDYKCVTLAQLV